MATGRLLEDLRGGPDAGLAVHRDPRSESAFPHWAAREVIEFEERGTLASRSVAVQQSRDDSESWNQQIAAAYSEKVER